MAKGNVAKETVFKKLADTFGQDFIGIYDKKAYVNVDDGGEKVQIAISLTCPKVPVGVVDSSSITGERNFEEASVVAPTTFTPAEITEEEKSNIAELMARLGL